MSTLAQLLGRGGTWESQVCGVTLCTGERGGTWYMGITGMWCDSLCWGEGVHGNHRHVCGVTLCAQLLGRGGTWESQVCGVNLCAQLLGRGGTWESQVCSVTLCAQLRERVHGNHRYVV